MENKILNFIDQDKELKDINNDSATKSFFCHSARNHFDFTILCDICVYINILFKGSLRDDKLMACCS